MPPAPVPVAGVSVWLVLGSIVLACHGYSRVYSDMPLYARCMLGTMRKQPRRSFVEGGLQKQADGDYLVFYGGLSAISFIILSSAPQKLVECRKSRNFGKIMRSTRQVYEPVYAGHDIIGARRFTSAPPPRKKRRRRQTTCSAVRNALCNAWAGAYFATSTTAVPASTCASASAVMVTLAYSAVLDTASTTQSGCPAAAISLRSILIMGSPAFTWSPCFT